MISICVTDNSAYDYQLYDSYQYECWSAIIDYMAHLYDSVLQHISVWLLTMTNNQCECLAIRCIDIQSQFNFFLSITQILFLFF